MFIFNSVNNTMQLDCTCQGMRFGGPERLNHVCGSIYHDGSKSIAAAMIWTSPRTYRDNFSVESSSLDRKSVRNVNNSSIVANNFEAHWGVCVKERFRDKKLLEQHVRTVKGTPFSFRMLVKYIVPEPARDRREVSEDKRHGI